MKKIFNLNSNATNSTIELVLFGVKFNISKNKHTKYPNYKNALKKIKRKYENKEKIKVAFSMIYSRMLSEHNRLERENDFEPTICITKFCDLKHNRKEYDTKYEKCVAFFEKTSKRIKLVYNPKSKKYSNLKNFDIIFYQQPWLISKQQNINNVSKYALCCYFPYGLDIFKSKLVNFQFHEKLFTYFLPNKYISEERKLYRLSNVNNEKIVGFHKLDIFKNVEKNNKLNKKTIIYAPHFGYKKSHELNIGTFDETGIQILEFAKLNRDYNWIFKPHPQLKITLNSDKNFGENFVEQYYKEWEKIGKIHDTGNYFQLFIDSDLIITDASSFLLEYMLSGNPIIRLIHKEERIPLNCFGQMLSNGWYQASSYEEFTNYFNNIIINNKDNLKEKRQEIISSCIDKNTSASEKILLELKNIIKSTLN